MARYTNRATKVSVNVSDEKGKRLGPEWEPSDVKPEPKKRAKKSDVESDS